MVGIGEAVVGAGEHIVGAVKSTGQKIEQTKKAIAHAVPGLKEDVATAAVLTARAASFRGVGYETRGELEDQMLYQAGKEHGMVGKDAYDLRKELPFNETERIRKASAIDAAIRAVGTTLLPATFAESEQALRFKDREARNIAYNQSNHTDSFHEDPETEHMTNSPIIRALQTVGEVVARVVPAAGAALGVVTPVEALAVSELAVRVPNFLQYFSAIRKERAETEARERQDKNNLYKSDLIII